MQLLSNSQLKQLHWAALEVLRNVGGRIYEDEALGLLKDAGCFVSDGNLVKFPAALVEAGVRDQVKVVIGGAPVTQRYADEIGADGYAPDAASAVDLARELVKG